MFDEDDSTKHAEPGPPEVDDESPYVRAVYLVVVPVEHEGAFTESMKNLGWAANLQMRLRDDGRSNLEKL